MARGNHESQTMNQMYGFEGEVKSKYSMQMASLFTEVYNWLPLAHCLNQRVLVYSTILHHHSLRFMGQKMIKMISFLLKDSLEVVLF